MTQHEGTNFKPARRYLRDNYGYDYSMSMQLFGLLKNKLSNLRLAYSRFMLGVVRMHMNGELNDPETIAALNIVLSNISQEPYLSSVSQDINGLSAKEAIDTFSNDYLYNNDTNNIVYPSGDSDYTIFKIHNFEEAEKFLPFANWCILDSLYSFFEYTHNGSSVFYFCIRDDYKNYPKLTRYDVEKGNYSEPIDNYGLSMLAVLIAPDGSLESVTSRYNLPDGKDGNLFTLGVLRSYLNLPEINFEPLTDDEVKQQKQLLVNNIQQDLKRKIEAVGREHISEIYGVKHIYGSDEHIGRRLYRYESQVYDDFVIIVDGNGNLFIDDFFEYVECNLYNDMISVSNMERSNFVSKEGKIVSPIWFNTYNRVGFLDSLTIVGFGEKTNNNSPYDGRRYNLLTNDGKLILTDDANCIYIDRDLTSNRFVKLHFKNGLCNFYDIDEKKLAFTKQIREMLKPSKFRGLSNSVFIKFNGEDYYQEYNSNTFELKNNRVYSFVDEWFGSCFVKNYDGFVLKDDNGYMSHILVGVKEEDDKEYFLSYMDANSNLIRNI